jgi:hypothetical protein
VKTKRKEVRKMKKTITLLSNLLFAMIVLSLLTRNANADSLDRHVRVYNDSSYSITGLHASTVAATGWEEDILGDGILRPGRYINVNIDDGSGYCRYDLKAVSSSGAEIIRWNVNVCEVTDWHIFNNRNSID